ncbi:hypothetical protein ACIBQ1_48280 [Nonomuraea sp. NPDC050153]|uniref:hypothetical protein n=1 Tax=Nonomuraea sp. NPDC050153 TaxID=3364359 RepID=UPI00379806A7
MNRWRGEGQDEADTRGEGFGADRAAVRLGGLPHGDQGDRYLPDEPYRVICP